MHALFFYYQVWSSFFFFECVENGKNWSGIMSLGIRFIFTTRYEVVFLRMRWKWKSWSGICPLEYTLLPHMSNQEDLLSANSLRWYVYVIWLSITVIRNHVEKHHGINFVITLLLQWFPPRKWPLLIFKYIPTSLIPPGALLPTAIEW